MQPVLTRAALDRPIAERFGARLKAARLRSGLTQAKLAEGRYTKAYISALENGLSKPSMAAVEFLATRLGLSATQLIDEPNARWSRIEADLRLAAGDWQIAADAYERLLRDETAPTRRAELLRGLAEASSRLDRSADAAAAGAEAAAIFESARRPADAAMARYWQSSGLYGLENRDEARSLLRQILDEIRGGLAVEPDLEIRAHIGLAMIYSRDGDAKEALGALSSARARVDELDDRRRAGFLQALAISYRESGDYEAAMTTANQAIGYFRSADDELETAILDNELALSHLALGTLDRARGHATAARERLLKIGNTVRLPNVLETEAQIELALGDLDAAERDAGAASEAAAAVGNVKAAVSAGLTRGRIARRRGDTSGAVAILKTTLALARQHERSQQIRDSLVELSEIAAENGDAQRGYELLREALAQS